MSNVHIDLIKEKMQESRDLLQHIQRRAVFNLGFHGLAATLIFRFGLHHPEVFIVIGWVASLLFFVLAHRSGNKMVEHLENEISSLNSQLEEPLKEPKLVVLRLTLQDMKLAALGGVTIYTALFLLEQTVGIAANVPLPK